jgi:hypothetical protein
MLHLGDVQISELARELDINPHKILKLLTSWGTNGTATPTSWVRAGLAERARAHITLARKQTGNNAFARSNSPAKLKPVGKSKLKCPNCKQKIKQASMVDHAERWQPRVRRTSRIRAIPKGPIAHLIDFAGTRGVREAAIREQLSRGGSDLEEIRAILK